MAKQRRRTVLAVDDDDINLMILGKNAQDAGYTVKSFTSGETAWDFLSNNPDEVDIAVLDKMMPGMSGLELLRKIKTHPQLRRIPVIIQTGDVGVAQMHEGLAEGAYYYLTKPFHPEIFTGILLSADNECTLREELVGQLAAGHATITDEGNGFDWQKLLTDDPVASRLASPNGRGCAKARVMLDQVQYNGKGNVVTCNIPTLQAAGGDGFEIVAA